MGSVSAKFGSRVAPSARRVPLSQCPVGQILRSLNRPGTSTSCLRSDLSPFLFLSVCFLILHSTHSIQSLTDLLCTCWFSSFVLSNHFRFPGTVPTTSPVLPTFASLCLSSTVSSALQAILHQTLLPLRAGKMRILKDGVSCGT